MKTMRFELALTVAILLFCCWCAYMILRINSSVASVVEQPTSQFQQDAFNQNSHQSRPSQVFYANKQPEATSPTAFYVGPASGNFYQNASLRVNHQLDAPQLKPPYSAQVSNWPLVAQRPPPASWQVSSNQWQTQRPNQTQQLVWRPRIAQPVQVEAEPEQEQDQDESGNAEEAGQEQSLQEDPDGAGSELEERSGGRQFSEDLSDASERDQQGRLINKRSKHLINGRQVKPNRKARKGVRDFERVVSEIDDQNAAQTSEEYDEQPDSRQPQESRPRPTRVRRPDSGEKRRQKKPAELHEHQMSESLQAQHWDDDASTKQPSESNATASTTTDEDAAEDELQTTTESPMQQEEVEFKDLDLFPDSAKLPFLDASEFELARRKKREIGLNVDTSNASDIRAAGESAPNSSLCAHPKLCANHLKGINIHAPSANKSASAASQVEELVGEEDFSVQLVGRPPIDQQPVSANTFYLPSPAEQVAVDGYHQHQPDGQQWTSSYQPLAELVSTSHEYLPIGSHAKVSKKKTKKKFKKSKMSDAKYKAAKAHAMKKKGGFKKGQLRSILCKAA